MLQLNTYMKHYIITETCFHTMEKSVWFTTTVRSENLVLSFTGDEGVSGFGQKRHMIDEQNFALIIPWPSVNTGFTTKFSFPKESLTRHTLYRRKD